MSSGVGPSLKKSNIKGLDFGPWPFPCYICFKLLVKAECLTVCATPITVTGSVMGRFPLLNGVYLVTTIK